MASVLYALFQPRWAFFELRRAKVTEILPLAVISGLQVVLSNCSVAYSTFVFDQLAQVYLTPLVAMIEFYIYKKTIPRMAAYALIPICTGIGALSYYEAVSQGGNDKGRKSPLGVFFAISGVLASSIYTVWIKVYHDHLQMNSLQLLLNHAPCSALLLLYLVPFTDTFPVWTKVGMGRWAMIFMVRRFGFILITFRFGNSILTVCRAAYVPVPSIYHNFHCR